MMSQLFQSRLQLVTFELICSACVYVMLFSYQVTLLIPHVKDTTSQGHCKQRDIKYA